MSLHSFESLEDTRQWIKSFKTELTRPCLVLLSGELGAGKTQFVRWFLEDLQVRDVQSPTFAIHNEYTSPSGPIDHVDLYRLTSDADLESSGFWDLFLESDRIVFVEWADRLPASSWPSAWKKINIRLRKGSGEQRREMEVEIEPAARLSGGLL